MEEIIPEIARLHGVKEKRTVVTDGRDVEWIIAQECRRIGGGQELAERIFRRVSRKINLVHMRFGDDLTGVGDVGIGKRLAGYENSIERAPSLKLRGILTHH